MSIETVLQERGERYGPFDGHAAITQSIKMAMHETSGWDRLSPSQCECLDMIAHKIGRILNGDPDYADNYIDIAGYAQLVVNELEEHEKTEVGLSDSNALVMRWHDIETAPKDRDVLIYKNGNMYCGYWAKNMITDHEAWVIANFGDDGDQLFVAAPTHWAELPPPPKQ